NAVPVQSTSYPIRTLPETDHVVRRPPPGRSDSTARSVAVPGQPCAGSDPPALLVKVGESFAGSLSALQHSLSILGRLAPDQQAILDAGLAEIARLEHLGVQIQEVARVLMGDAPAAPERVDLARAAREALAQRADLARLKDVHLGKSPKPFDLDVNAAVLEQLLDLGLEYASRIGSQVEIGAAMGGRPEHPVLSIRVERAQTPTAADGDQNLNELHCLLFVHLAPVGLAPQRLASARAMTLT